MISTTKMKRLQEKSVLWNSINQNNPASVMIKSYHNLDNMKLYDLMSEKDLEISLDKDNYGYDLLDYANVNENFELIKKYNNLKYIPVLGEFYLDMELPLIKNLSYDKKPILKSTKFLMNSKYDFLNQKNFNEAIKLIYPNAGKKTYKLMEKFLYKENYIDFTVFHFAHYCSVYFEDPNYFNELLENIDYVDFFEKLIPIHFILNRMSEKRIKSFLISTSKEDLKLLGMLVNDVVSMYNGIIGIMNKDYELDFKAIESLHSLHESLVKDYNLISRHGENLMLFLDRKFPYLNQLSKEPFNDLTVVIPKDKATLIEWGNTLGNCIGSYAENARDGETIVLALYKNDKVKYNIEISPNDGKVLQFVENSNARVDNELFKQFQDKINQYFIKTNQDEKDEFVFRFPVDNRYLVNIIKVDGPVDEGNMQLNQLFQLNLKSKIKCTDGFDLQSIGIKNQIPKATISLILEDKNSKGSLIKLIANCGKSAYSGLLSQFKDTKHLNLRTKDYKSLVNDINKVKQDGYNVFFIGIDKLVKMTNSIPSALQPIDYVELNNILSEVKNDINIFFVITDVVKSKNLVYKDSKCIESMCSQIYFTHKEKIIDDYFKIDIIKSVFGEDNVVINVKELK